MPRALILLAAFAALLLAPFGHAAMAATPCTGGAPSGHHMSMADHPAKPVAAADSCCAALVAALPDQAEPVPVRLAATAPRDARLTLQLDGIEPVGHDPPPRS